MNSIFDDLPVNVIDRRRFCNRLLLTGAGIAFAASALPESSSAQSGVVAWPPLRIDGANMLLPGSALLFNYPRPCDPAILARTDDGKFYAYSQKCSHMGCSVHFSRILNRLDCPCHRGAFDVKNGMVVNGPPRRALDEIILQMRGDEVWAVGRRHENENPIVV